ncbi:hypothetical protein QR685DRAFT_569703 [Neurospora intermedia]|uniref:Uncharacterized protein n=1 Tax=Neurospora intermedia TaxID=5142 RepID=A0ABR3DMY0_NEUIN
MTPAISCTRHKGTEPRAASRCLHAHAPVSHGVVQTRQKSLQSSAEHSLSQVAPEAIRVRTADKQLVEHDPCSGFEVDFHES